jgi:hypothetical protein
VITATASDSGHQPPSSLFYATGGGNLSHLGIGGDRHALSDEATKVVIQTGRNLGRNADHPAAHHAS